MRCPKCGFISFDHIDHCLKCAKEVEKTSMEMEGTTFNATSPSFLSGFSGTQELEQETFESDDYGEIGVADNDLDTLIDKESTESFDDELSLEDFPVEESAQESDEDEISMEDFDDNMTMDLGQFEDELDEEPASNDTPFDQPDDDFQAMDSAFESLEEEEQDFPAMDVPEELEDISDLDTSDDGLDDFTSLDEDEDGFTFMEEEEELITEDLSGLEKESDIEPVIARESEVADDDFVDPDIAGLNLDLGLDEKSEGSIFPEEDISQEGLSDVSLSDIDLSDTVGSVGIKKKDKQDSTDSDPDLDFSLDLYGVTLPDDQS